MKKNKASQSYTDEASDIKSQAKGKKRRKSSAASTVVTVILVLVMIIGVGIMAYPSFSDWYNGLHQSRAIADYNQVVSSNDDSRNEELWNEAVAYNEDLAKTGINLALSQYNAENLDSDNTGDASEDTDGQSEDDTSSGTDVQETNNGTSGTDSETDDAEADSADDSLAAQRKRYYETLDVSGTGIMGYIDIDKVNIHLPIYHDTSEGVLQVAVGHLAGTSLPVGGASSHCVLTGHTGLPSAKLFTDIDQLEIGDTFQLVVLDHVLTYEVDDISVVLPYEVSSLQIEEGEDLCTLVTCTPYGINTHRLLVRGHRIPTPVTASEDTDTSTDTTTQTTQPLPSDNWESERRATLIKELLPVILAAAVVLIVILLLIHSARKKKKIARQEEAARAAEAANVQGLDADDEPGNEEADDPDRLVMYAQTDDEPEETEETRDDRQEEPYDPSQAERLSQIQVPYPDLKTPEEQEEEKSSNIFAAGTKRDDS